MKWPRLVLPLAGLAVFVMVLRQVDLAVLGRDLATVGGRGFLAVLAVHALSFLCDSLLWQASFERVPPPAATWWTFYRIRLVGEAYNNALPLASVGGEPIKAKLLKDAFDIDYTATGAAFLIAKTANLIALVVFLAVGFWIMLEDPRFPPAYRTTAGLGLAAFALGCGALWAAQQGRLARWVHRALHGRGETPRVLRALDALTRFDAQLAAVYRRAPRRFFVILLLAFATWVAGVFEIQIILAAVGTPVGVGEAWMVEAAAQLVRAAAFFIPAGLGVVDGSFVLMVGIVTGSPALGVLVAVVRRARDLVWIGLGVFAGLQRFGPARRR